jgi:hypothetical protein
LNNARIEDDSRYNLEGDRLEDGKKRVRLIFFLIVTGEEAKYASDAV